jgi:hypothetical protein
VTVHATGIVKETNKKFWSTKDEGQQPFTYQAGVGKVIVGWDQGCLGMAIGEVRELEIPFDEGYGARGFPAWGIPPNGGLNFNIEVRLGFARMVLGIIPSSFLCNDAGPRNPGQEGRALGVAGSHQGMGRGLWSRRQSGWGALEHLRMPGVCHAGGGSTTVLGEKGLRRGWFEQEGHSAGVTLHPAGPPLGCCFR